MIAEILVNVSFLRHTLIKSDAGVVEGDYNTTKLIFNFEEDVSGHRIVFKMSNPAGDIVLLKDIENNEVLLTGKDEEGKDCSLFQTQGLYPFELVLYGEDSKLTSAPGWMNASKRQVSVLDSVTLGYLPLFEKLLGELGENTLFLRFSQYPDGTDFTDSWKDGQRYIGIAAGFEAPTDKSGYNWGALPRGEDGKDGIDGKDGTNGKDGSDGTDGKDGTSVTISKVSESTVSGGSNIVTFSDGKTLTVKNGKDGINGKDGTNGTNGKDGSDGKTPYIQDGYWYINGTNTNVKAAGVDGKNGTSVSVLSVSESKVDGGSNVVKFSDGNTVAVKNGTQGSKGETGKNAYEYAVDGGFKGSDGEFSTQINPSYLLSSAMNYIDNELAKELAQRGQLKPEFVNSIEECTDTSKLYVLPDGYIYGFMVTVFFIYPTNQIRESINADGTLFNNGTGWKTGCTLNSSDGAERTDKTAYEVTGFIPYKASQTFRIKNYSMPNTADTYNLACFYNSNFGFVGAFPQKSSYNPLTQFVKNDGTIEACIATAATTNFTADKINSIAYVRFGFLNMSDSTFITVDEPLEATTTTTQGWHSTGHAFVPADYEGRIIAIEHMQGEQDGSMRQLEKAIAEISARDSNVPSYISDEAKRVADVVKGKQTVGSLTFTAMSDFHIEVDTTGTHADNLTSCRDAGLGLSELQKHFKLDFTAMLGDYTWMSHTYTTEQVKKDITYVKNKVSSGMRGVPNVWCTGNHDINYGTNSDRRMTEDELYAYITNNNTGTIQDGENIGRNYGYIDFANQKIRCIYLNTIDSLDYPDYTDGTADDAMEITAIQAQWLVDVGLNLTTKSNPTEWGIVILSHHCISQFMHITEILTSYRNGTSGSVSVTTNNVTTAVNYNFSSTNRGEIICAVHGHDHNFTYRKISTERWDKVTEANAWLWSICVPNVDTTRNNEKATSTDEAYKKAFGEFDSSGNPVYYKKTQGTSKSTSFCILTVDRKNRKIHAIAYGAGIDREINY